MVEACGSEKRVDCGGLAEADFERYETAGREGGESGGDQAAVEIEAIGASKESEGRFMVADFDGQCVPIDGWDVGRVGEDEVEPFIAYGTEKVALDETDPGLDGVEGGVLPGDG